jgi:transcriptional regulator with XRE-family HTH domain
MQLGEHIRKIRRQHRRTLQEIADAAEISKSLLSKIETGATSPPVATLMRISDALGVPVSSLMDPTADVGTVFTPSSAIETKKLTRTDKGYLFCALAAGRADKRMQVFMFEAERGKVKRQPLSHGGEEFVYMLQGRMKYRVASVEYTLGPGDSLYFDGEDDHDLAPITDRVRYLAVFVDREAQA